MSSLLLIKLFFFELYRASGSVVSHVLIGQYKSSANIQSIDFIARKKKQ